MASENNHAGLSPTVLRVIERFVAAMRADDAIQDDAIDRLETLLRKGTVPKPDEIRTALLKPLQDDQT